MAWQIRAVSDETVDVVKRRAKQRGLSIGQFLDWHFSEYVDMVQNDKGNYKEYRIKLKTDTMNNLRRKAADEGYGVPQYLEHIAKD